MSYRILSIAIVIFIIASAISFSAGARNRKWCKHAYYYCSHPVAPKHPADIVHGSRSTAYGRARYYYPTIYYAKDKDAYGYYANRYYDGCRYYAQRYYNCSRYSDGCRRTSRRHFRSEWH